MAKAFGIINSLKTLKYGNIPFNIGNSGPNIKTVIKGILATILYNFSL